MAWQNLSWRDLEREMDLLRREMDRVFADFSAGRRIAPAFSLGRWRDGAAYPAVNMREDMDALHLDVLAPGIDPETLDVSVQGTTLRIAGEKTALADSIPQDAFHRRERGAGRFTRVIQLGAEIAPEQVEAKYRHGIVHIRLPKAEQAKPKQIAVKVD
jgi:HSP20 family protein